MKENRFAYDSDLGLNVLSEEDILNSFNDKKNITKGSLEDLLDETTKKLEKNVQKLEKAHQLFIEKDFYDKAFEIEQRIEKAKKDITKLVKVKKLITRNGKSFITTVYENPKTGEREEKKKVEVASVPEIGSLAVGDVFMCKTARGTGTFKLLGVNSDAGIAFLTTKVVGTDDIRYIKSTSISDFKKVSTEAKETFFEEKKIPPLKDLKYENVELGGSSGVKLYSDKDGELYAVKKSHKGNPDQLKQEALVSKIYKNFGIKTSDSYYDSESQTLISKYIVGKEIGKVEDKSAYKKEIQKGFVLDVILANYDVIGQAGDNILIKDGEAYRIDLGGCIEFRARGGDKWFSSTPKFDLFSMKDRNFYFKDISNDDIKSQLESIVKNKEGFSILDSLINEKGLETGKHYHSTILSRLKSLCDTYGVDFSEDAIKKEEKSKDKLRTDMPSMVTQKYFDEEWNKVNIEGNPGLKDHIKKHILEIEKKYKDTYESIAHRNKISVEKVKENMQLWWTELVKRSDGYIVAHSGESYSSKVVDKILISGRFKTQFETGTSEGANDPFTRSSTEYGYFGFPKHTTPEAEDIKHLRPIYGYFTDIDNGVLNSEGKIPPPRSVRQYGDVAFKVKKEKFLKDATVTFDDSLGEDYSMAATPAAAPHFTSIPPNNTNYNELKKMYESHAGKDRGSRTYVEVQYHNQLTVDDVESAHICLNEYLNEDDKSDLSKVSNVVNIITEAVAVAKKPIKIKLF